jgi:hypothetical protein
VDELIRRLNAGGVRYLLMGGQAVRLAGMPRFSMDWDFLIPSKDPRNLEALNVLLRDEVDVPVVPLGPRGENFVQTYQTRWGIVQFHLAGPGLPDFAEAEKRAVIRTTELGTPVRCLSTMDLVRSKEAAGRPQDVVDLDFLRAVQEKVGGG